MSYEEACAWLYGTRSSTNMIPRDPFDTWQVRILQADSAMVQIAYWIVRAHKEGLIKATP